MATTEVLVERLCTAYPEDAEDLREALGVLRQQRLQSCERLRGLSDAQWQRLGLPLGIESLLRNELDAAVPSSASSLAADGVPSPPPRRPGGSAASSPATSPTAAATRVAVAAAAAPEAYAAEVDEDDAIPLEPFEPPSGLYRRGGAAGGRHAAEPAGGGGTTSGLRREPQSTEGQDGLLGPLELTAPANLEELWQSLLEETLPPDRWPSLQAAWNATPEPHERYMMLLEYSSYLRKPELTEEEKAARKKELEPFLRELGAAPDGEDEGCSNQVLYGLLVGLVLFVTSTAYYYYAWPDLAHDPQSL